MDATLSQCDKDLSDARGPGLPPRMRVLYVATPRRTGGWLAEAFAADSASKVLLEEAIGSAAGLARLRDEPFDAVLVNHEPDELDALDLIEGYRAGGECDPIVVLGTQSEQEMAALCYEVGADAYICVNTTTTRNLIWVVGRAIQRHELFRENQRLLQAERLRLQQQHDETDRLLQQQRALLGDLETLQKISCLEPPIEPANSPLEEDNTTSDESADARPARCRPPRLPEELIGHYRELLRTYVIMGSGNLGWELTKLAELLTSSGVTGQETMQLHLHVLEELIHGLGARSTRHVMTRADLLVLEIMMHLAEGYRGRYQERIHPPVQKQLPGFE